MSMESGFFRGEEELKPAKAKYERFKLTWMLDNNFTLADLIRELDILVADSDPSLSLKALFADWELGYGFGSQIWPCFEEFLECEYKEMEATRTLICNVNGPGSELAQGIPDPQQSRPPQINAPQSKALRRKEAER